MIDRTNYPDKKFGIVIVFTVISHNSKTTCVILYKDICDLCLLLWPEYYTSGVFDHWQGLGDLVAASL